MQSLFRTYAVLLWALCAAACAPSVGGNPGDPDGGSPDAAACTGAAITCLDTQTVSSCEAGKTPTTQRCTAPQVCGAGLGCVDCAPSQGTVCVGAEVHACGEGGKIGGVTRTCPMGCQGGQCLGGTCGASGTDLIYVVDKTYRLLSFNPRGGLNEFKVVGTLSCPAGAPLRGGGTATPLSMSIDRAGKAYVLYTSGEIFFVSTADASCQRSSFKVGQAGFEFFGMGFVANDKGSSQETLFVAGGGAAMLSTGQLGQVQAAGLTLSAIGDLALASYPELTGTGNGELYAYFPGPFYPRVHRLDKGTAKTAQEWKLTSPGTVRSYAFAHWGGQFYVFVTTDNGSGALTSKVSRWNPVDNSLTEILPDTKIQVVGAGVSTCAPVVVG